MQKAYGFSSVAFVFAAAVVLAISGCQTRSISDSGYKGDYYSAERQNTKELSEFDILGIDPKVSTTQNEIEQALATKHAIILPKGSSIMLIQSGADIPDDAMVRAIEQYYDPMPFSGDLNWKLGKDQKSNAAVLRLAAARGGCEKIVVYWGTLETAGKGLGTKGVSWIPILGGAIPDKAQEMRIRLKAAVVDVKTGQWDLFALEPFEDKAISAKHTRESSDQNQVAELKMKGYKALAKTLSTRYGG